MIIGEIMIDESHDYDLEEGEILEDEEGEVVNISKSFENSPYHDIDDNMQHIFHSGTEKYFSLREESRYPEKLYFSSDEDCFPKRNHHKYPRIKDTPKKERTSQHSNDYKLKIKKSSTFKFRKKSRSRSCSVSSSSSSCSCSSCTSCSASSFHKKTVQLPSHSSGVSRYSKSSGKSGKEEKNSSHLQRKKEAIKSAVKTKSRKRNLSSSKLVRERSPSKKLKKLAHKDLIRLNTKTNSYRQHLPEKSSKKKVGSRNTKTVKFKSKSPLRTEKSTKHTVLSKSESLTDIVIDTDLTLPKPIPGSLGEMLLKKQLKGELKKDIVSSSEKGTLYVQGKDSNGVKPIIDSPKTFEIVDLCHDNEDESEEDELTLRIKALQSAKTRELLGKTKIDQQEDNNSKSSNLEKKDQINPSASSKIDYNINKDELSECQNLGAILILENEVERKKLDFKESDGLNNDHPNLEEKNHSSENSIDDGKIERNELDSGMTVDEQLESEEVNNNHSKLVKDKCEIASIDMDISNDSFGDNIPTQSDNNESEIKTGVVSQSQDSTFPIPVEWAYMIPPPCNTDQLDDDTLNNIRNWCFNQNMFIQSMQESVNNMNPVDSRKSVEANSSGTDCYNGSNTTSNYYYQQPLATSETRRVVTYDEYQCDYNSSIVPTVDTSVQSGELRDCHAEQYKSFMSTVIQNNCPQASHKKDQHRDLINIDLRPGNFQNSNLVSVKPDTKLNIVKRRSRKRRRSNRKSGNGNNLPIALKHPQEINKTAISAIDDDDEDMLRAMLLNEMSLKNQNVCQGKQKLEINNNSSSSSNKNGVNERKKLSSNRNERLVKVGKSLEISFSNQNPKFRKAGLQTKSKYPIERRFGPKRHIKPKSQESKLSEQKFGNDSSGLRNFSLSKFPPVKPVIISINEDSDTEDERVKKVETVNSCDKLISGIDSFIRSFRNKQTTTQEKSTKPPSILTPKGVSHLSEEKQQEYRRLKQLMISKRKVLQMKSKKVLTSKKLSNFSEDRKDISGECKPKKNIQENEQNMDVNLNGKFCSNVSISLESEDVKQSKMMDKTNGENELSLHLSESERTNREHLVVVPVATSKILSVNNEIHNSVSVQNSTHKNVEEEKKNCILNDPNNESICSESIENCNVVNDEALPTSDNSEPHNVVNDEVLSTRDNFESRNVVNDEVLHTGDPNLESKNILSSNLQQVTQEVSELNDCLDESLDSSEDSSSSESESSSSSSSSSNDSDTDIEEQTEIDLRNRLLRKRQELLQKSNDSFTANGSQFSIENRNTMLKCDQSLETSSVGSQDEIINLVGSNDHLSYANSCGERDEVQCGHSPATKETGEEKENEPTDHIKEKEEFLPPGDPPFKTILLNSSSDNVENKSIGNINSLKRDETEKSQITNSGSKGQSVEGEVAVTPPSLKKGDTNDALRAKQVRNPEKLTRTLGKLQEEINNRILSVEDLTSRISDLFLEAEREESFCQNIFDGIIKLLSQISEFRKSRKEKKSHITVIFAKVFKLLEKVNEDLSFVNRMENFLQQHYDLNQLLLVTSLNKKKKEQEFKRTLCLQKFKQLREKIKLLDSQEAILNKTFSKPLECTSPRTANSRGPITPMRPFRQNQKKKQFKLDNRHIFERQRNEVISSPSNKVISSPSNKVISSPSNKWTLNNIHIASSVLTTPRRSATTVATVPSENAGCRQQNEIMESQSSKYTSKISEDMTSGTINQPENDKFVGDIVLCPYDLLGRCNDDQCIYQHVSAAAGQVKSSLLCSFKNPSDSNRQSQNNCKFEINKATRSKKLNEQLADSSKVDKVDDSVLDIKERSSVLPETLVAKTEVANTPIKEESTFADSDIAPSCSLLKQSSPSKNRLKVIPDETTEQTNSAFPIGKRACRKRKILSSIPLKGVKFSKNENDTKIDRTLEDKPQLLSSSSVDQSPVDTQINTSNRKVTVIFYSSPEKEGEKSERIPNSPDESAETLSIGNALSYPEASGSTDNHPITVETTTRNIRPKGKRRGGGRGRGRVMKTLQFNNKVKRVFHSSRILRSDKRVIRGRRFKQALPRT